MIYPRIKLGFSTLSNSNLLNLARNVVTQMTKNQALFSEEASKLEEEIKIQSDEFRKLINEANTGSKLAIQKRNSYRISFQKTINDLARLLNTFHAGDGNILNASGYKVLDNAKSRTLTDIDKIVTSDGKNKGYVDIFVKGAENFHCMKVDYYVGETAPEIWMNQVFTRKKATLGKFNLGDFVTLQITVFGKDNSYKKSELYKWACTN